MKKIEELHAETKRLVALAVAITNKSELTRADCNRFEEYLSLIYEIEDYAARLQRPGEKWRCRA
jgi:hypothetical protein